MGMSVGGGTNTGAAPMASINVTPLVDVMLVLLIIFMITTPLMQNLVDVEVPRATLTAEETPRRNIDLAIEANGNIWWDDAPKTMSALETDARRAARENPQPEVRIRADANLRYQTVREVMTVVKDAGIARVAFVTGREN